MQNHKISIKYLIGLSGILFFTTFCSAQSVARFDPSDNTIEIGWNEQDKDQIKGIVLIYSEPGKPACTIPITATSLITTASNDYLQINLNHNNAAGNPVTCPIPTNFPFLLSLTVEAKAGEITLTSTEVLQLGSKPKTELQRKTAEGREDANVYVSGNADVAIGKGPEFEGDVKLEKEISLSDNVAIYGTPFVDFKISNDDEATDKFNAGAKFRIGKPTKGIRYSFSGELESDYKWKVVNVISRQELRFRLSKKDPSYEEKGVTKVIAFPRFFIGGEFGGNLKSPLARPDRGIARLLAGASLELKWFEPLEKTPLKVLKIKKLIWENKFEQRWFLAKEQAYDKEENMLVLKDFGRKPRSYFSSNLHFRFNDFWGPTLSYEWGELPPLYNKVKHNLKVGLTYSFAVAPKE